MKYILTGVKAGPPFYSAELPSPSVSLDTNSACGQRSHVPSRTASQTTATPRISTPIPHPNVSAITPYSSSLPLSAIPNTTLSAPSHTSSSFAQSCQYRCQLHTIHTLSSLRTPQTQNPIYDTTRVPGLEPRRSLPPPFATVVSYETYQLHDKRTVFVPNENLELHRIKQKLEGLIPTLNPFNGTNAIKLLHYFAGLRRGLDALGFPEASAVRSLHFLPEGEAEKFYESFAARGTLYATRSREFTCPHVVHALLDRYLTDSELRKAHDRVTLM